MKNFILITLLCSCTSPNKATDALSSAGFTEEVLNICSEEVAQVILYHLDIFNI